MITVDLDSLPIEPGVRILDAGCGTGRHLAEAVRFPGVTVIGIDLNPPDLIQAGERMKGITQTGPSPASSSPGDRSRSRQGNWWLIRGSVLDLPCGDGVFDLVICSEVLEHFSDSRPALRELIRVLRPGGHLVVSVPRYLPERICWALSRSYRKTPGGHVVIFRKKELLALLAEGGLKCLKINYRHALHSPYWWLKCLVGQDREQLVPVRLYRRFLEWDIMKKPSLTVILEKLLNPLLGKSIVLYLRKEP